MTNFSDDPTREQRTFPRITARCPVLYQTPGSKRWHVAMLVDFSATGLRIACDEMLIPGTPISIQIKPGSNKVIPAVSGKGSVVRCEPNNDLRYEVSCKLTRVSPA